MAQAAIEAGFEVELLVRHRNSNIERLLGAGAHFTAVEYTDRATYRKHMEWADVLFHVATGNHDEASDSEAEIARGQSITEQLLHTAVAEGVPRIVYTSPAEVLGRNTGAGRQLSEESRTKPDDVPWVRAKVAAEEFCDRLVRDHHVDLRRLYPGWLVGSMDVRGTGPQRLIRRFLQGKTRLAGGGGMSVTPVADAARAHVAAALHEERGGRWVLGGENLTVGQLRGLLGEISGIRDSRMMLPAILTRGGSYQWYDSSRAGRELAYGPRGARTVLEQGVRFERQRAAGTNALFARGKSAERRGGSGMEAAPLAVFGAPGWVANRFLHVLLNGDRHGFRYARREVRLMVQPRHCELFEVAEPFRVIPVFAKRPEELRGELRGAGMVVDLVDAERVSAVRASRLIEHCRAAGVRRLVYLVAGTGEAEQVEAERLILAATAAGEIEGTVLKTYWLCGPFAPARHERLLRSWRKGRQAVAGTGDARRTVTHVDHVVAAVLGAERAKESIGRTYAVGEGDYTVDRMRRTICEAAGETYDPVRVPEVVCAAARAVETGIGRMGRDVPAAIRAWARADVDFVAGESARADEFGCGPVISFEEYAREWQGRGRPVAASRKAYASS